MGLLVLLLVQKCNLIKHMRFMEPLLVLVFFYNLTDNIQLNSGYELGIIDNKEINTFIIGIGYLF
ncbi:hypothetical protein QY91_04715 [Enterobacter ludwigii]|nr:hypothetical protein BH714_04760 [Enterobacter ludwigii]KIF85156.1 hypothetical protein QY91_04715 [Enterobacter ludwigii]